MTSVTLAGMAGRTPVTASFTVSSGFTVGVDAAANDARNGGGTPAALAWSYNTISTALKRDLGGRLKFFDQGSGITKAVQMQQAVPATPHPVLCIQTYTAAALNAWMNGLSAQCGLVYKQEFTSDLAKGSYTPGQFNGWYADLRSIIDAHPKGHLVDLQMVGAEFAERNASKPWWPQIVVPDRCAIGNDTYIQQVAQLDPAKGFANGLAWWKSVQGQNGVTWRTSEGGYSRVNFTPAQRITAFQTLAQWLPAQGASSYNYWAVDNTNADSTKDWSVDKPGDEAVAAALASLM